MKRMWWGLLGVAILATTSGCRHTCGESKCKLFSRDSGDTAPTRLTSATRDNAACSVPLGYPMSSGPVSGPSYPAPGGGIPTPGSGPGPDMIPPTFVPAVPMAVPPSSAKNILPPPLALSPPASAVGYPK